MRGFYYITDRKLSSKPDVDGVREAVEGGAAVVQYREKELDPVEKSEIAAEMKRICEGRAVFLINDNVDIALEVDADGVHLGQEDTPLAEARRLLGPDRIIGVTVHNVEEALAAEAGCADYVAASPIYATSTKEDAGEPAGLELIVDVKAAVKIPVAAIGGIDESNIDDVVSARADMACAISATVTKEDIRAAVEYFARKWTK
ncbi:MAG: thiamine phosphate synthase [Candidatus Altiarchaeales archaeon]|nr:thiamine phosphate synthase [Candidatus Altiarchaeales archaeon]MBD3416116.1 thiamine phosphate synthase [Candidatus Altiarchaeales archaeon]